MAIVASAALFASGLAVGALGVHLFYSQKIVAAGGPPVPIGPGFERFLVHRLDLDDEQRERARVILEDSRFRAEELRREMRPRVRAMNQEAAEALAEILTPEQQAKLTELMERREQREHRLREREGPPRGRPPARDRSRRP